MRGKANIGDDIGDDFRITPAYAGKSEIRLQRVEPPWDHPRLCGEKISLLVLSTTILGSPPPMRGKDDDALTAFNKSRITPAYAGKSSIVSPSSAVDWDHPRLCGEKSFCTVSS